MVVMPRTTQPECVTAKVPGSISGARAVPIEAAGSAEEVANEISQGRAFLKVVETPWGIEFYVVGAGV